MGKASEIKENTSLPSSFRGDTQAQIGEILVDAEVLTETGSEKSDVATRGERGKTWHHSCVPGIDK